MNEQDTLQNGQNATNGVDEHPKDWHEQLTKTQAEAAEFKDQWLRAVADYKNFKRRAETERSELLRSAGGAVVLKMLPILDDMERAIEGVPANLVGTPWWDGLLMIAQKFRVALESEGVKPIETLGAEFDPNLHEATMYESDPANEGKVTAELRKGYMLHDRVLRPALVKVATG